MQYLLMIYGNESAMLKAPKEASSQILTAYTAYTEAIKKAGVLVGSNRLRPTSEATTVRAPNGKKSVVNGPFAEIVVAFPPLSSSITLWPADSPDTAPPMVKLG